MNTGWSRPDHPPGGPESSGPDDDVIEIELEGEGPRRLDQPADSPSTAAPAHEPNWQRIGVIAALAGTAIGVTIALAVLSDDDEPEQPDPTPPTGATVPSTTPPTLPPVTDDPGAFGNVTPATLPLASGDGGAQLEADPISGVLDAEPLRPQYATAEPQTEPDHAADGSFDLIGAIRNFNTAPPAATEVFVIRPNDVATYVAERDDTNGRLRLTSFSNAIPNTVQVDDHESGTWFRTSDLQRWVRVDEPATYRIVPIDERLASGLMPDAINLGGQRLVTLADGTVAREVGIDGPGWPADFPPATGIIIDDPATAIGSGYVYLVDDTIVELHVVVNGDEPTVLVQRFHHDATPRVALPDPADVANLAGTPYE